MKAQDLRIGNLFQDQNKNLLKVSELTKEGKIVFSVVDRSKFPLNPGWQAQEIPLTTEIIEKLGGVFFDYEPLPDSDRHRLYYKFKLSDESYLMVTTNQVGEIKIYIHEGQTDAEIFLREIQFVHELQNAFHGISGKELEFKL